MSVDTANRRGSAFHVGLPWRGMFATPDGSVDSGDLAPAAGYYRFASDEADGFSLQIAWDGSTYVDETANLWFPISTKRGRAKATDEFAAGTGSFRLKNITGRYTVLYSGSALYPNVLPARPVKMTYRYNGMTYYIFTGKCTPEGITRSLPEPCVSFSMVDAFEELRLGLVATPVQQAKRVDELLDAIFDAIGDSADRDFDTGPDTLTAFPIHNYLPLNAALMAVRQDPGGRFFIGKDGTRVYQNRFHSAAESIYATLAGTFEDIDPNIRQEDLVDSARATWPRFNASAVLSVVYSQNLAIPCRPGDTDIEFEVNASGVVGATGYVTPLVATTDFVANSEQDGSGTDKTAQVSIAITANDSGGGTLTVTNLDSSTTYLTTLQVRGYPVEQGSEVNAYRKTVTSPIITGQRFNRDFEYMDDAPTVKGFVNWKAATLGDIRVRPTVTITTDTEALTETVLGAEIGKRVALSDTGASWLSQVDAQFVIEGIELNFPGPTLEVIEARWTLFDRDMSGASMFLISPDAGDVLGHISEDTGTPTERISY